MTTQDQDHTEQILSHLRAIESSRIFLTIYNEDMTSVKEMAHDTVYAMEIGAAILMNKPIALLVPRGTNPPERLKRVSDHIRYFDKGNKQELYEAAKYILQQHEIETKNNNSNEQQQE